ncbi:MAG: amidohydrolase family protein [Phycisphaerae bacterium]
MIVDCHTHIWDAPTPIGLDRLRAGFAADPQDGANGGVATRKASVERHLLASKPVDKSFVLGFKSRFLGVEIPSDLIVQYVRAHPDKLIGFAGIDPTNLHEAMDDLQRAHGESGIGGITVSPAAQDFHPADSRAVQVFAEAERLRMPVLLHQGIHFASASKMDFARPVLFDEVARDFPDLKLVIAHLGYPWVEECIVLLGRHRNVYADISAMLHQPWQAYNALLSAHQYGVMDKLLFGSDFPFGSATAAIEALFRLNQLVTGTNLPTVPRQFLAAIVERDALALLGIHASAPSIPEKDDALLDVTEP